MKGCLHGILPVFILIVVAIYFAFPHPTHNQEQLKAVADESRRLMKDYPLGVAGKSVEVPRNKWPPAIAGLKPKVVTVRPAMVDVWTTPFFDGGWGYGFATDKQDLGMLAECWSELGHNIYWHGPC